MLDNYDGNVKFSLVEKQMSLECLFPSEGKELLQDSLAELFEELSHEKYHPYDAELLKFSLRGKSVA